MSRDTHTPGPWVVSSMEMSKKDWAALHSGDLTIVRANWDGHRGDVIAVVWSDDEHSEAANGLLVAEAPNLLAAAIDALALIRKGAPGWGVAKDILGAAIGKATGEIGSGLK